MITDQSQQNSFLNFKSPVANHTVVTHVTRMIGLICLIVSLASLKLATDASDSVTAALLEEVLSLKEQVAELQLAQETQQCTCSCESSTNSVSS